MDFSSTNQKTETKSAKSGHRLELDYGRALLITGVIDVPVFTDKNATVRLQEESLFITGQDLTLKSLDSENGKLLITGKVFSIKYASQATPSSFIKKLLK